MINVLRSRRLQTETSVVFEREAEDAVLDAFSHDVKDHRALLTSDAGAPCLRVYNQSLCFTPHCISSSFIVGFCSRFMSATA